MRASDLKTNIPDSQVTTQFTLRPLPGAQLPPHVGGESVQDSGLAEDEFSSVPPDLNQSEG